ncbi:MAG: zinc ribbon domain-containing protein [Patescibacteria group bacterium]|nr:zinc ribbon domain-containing protein [Patescibacteria group bacterium]
MPIYEFYCPTCHVIFNFFARRADTAVRPACPRCQRPNLDRKMSRFAISKGRPEPGEGGDDPFSGMDEAAMEATMTELAREADGMNEDDPRQMARMMRNLFEKTGMQPGQGMEEALRRLEAGEDPDQLEADMGDMLDDDASPFAGPESQRGMRGLARKLRPPAVDETLYDL